MSTGHRRTEAEARERLATLGPDADPIDRLCTAIRAHLLAVLASTDATSASIKMIGQVPPDIRRGCSTSSACRRQPVAGHVDRRPRRRPAEETTLHLSIVRMTIIGAVELVRGVEPHGEGLPREDRQRHGHTVMLQGLLR